jgi:hypothetical protein
MLFKKTDKDAKIEELETKLKAANELVDRYRNKSSENYNDIYMAQLSAQQTVRDEYVTHLREMIMAVWGKLKEHDIKSIDFKDQYLEFRIEQK